MPREIIPQIHFFKTVESTNDLLKEKAGEGAPEGTVIAAREQTSGKGRMGRSFFSPGGTGIYMSILLRPRSFSDIDLITPMAAVAAAKSIEKITLKKAAIKWVNDIYVDSKKVCGILTESFLPDRGGGYVIVGIGINFSEPGGGFPPELKDIAGAVYKNADEKKRAELRDEVIRSFFEIYLSENKKPFINEYKNRSFVTGKEITVTDGNSVYRAKALSIDDGCRLLVEKENGEQRLLFSGEISIRIN